MQFIILIVIITSIYLLLLLIGYETARSLASHGAHVILACRDRGRGAAAVNLIQKSHVCTLHL